MSSGTKVISEKSHTIQTGRMRISHLGRFGFRSNRASTTCLACLEREIREIPFFRPYDSPVLFQNPPATFHRIVLAVVGRVVQQLDGFTDVIGEFH